MKRQGSCLSAVGGHAIKPVLSKLVYRNNHSVLFKYGSRVAAAARGPHSKARV